MQALSNEILMSIDKPARYIGGEYNMVKKELSQVDIRFAMCFPDVYEIGMSHLGIQILYDMMNKAEGVYCERVYSPWHDLDKIMREKHIPLFTLETQTPIKNMDFLGITIQYEMCYTNILQILDLSNIPLHSFERTDSDPIVIGGGPCTYNPEPIADFFDMFYIGEGETQYTNLFNLYRQAKKDGLSRKEFLRLASKIPGIYVPSLYDVKYNDDGTIKSFLPLYDDVPTVVKKEVVSDLDDTYYPEKPLVPYIRATQDRVVLEVMRGCIRGCRFCQAGFVYRPVRTRSIDRLKYLATHLLENTGHEEITLSSLSTSDYPDLPELLDYIIDYCKPKNISVSLPSLRIDSFSLDVMSRISDISKCSLTFAPEAGSQRLRNVINKGLTKEQILEGATLAFNNGWNKVKLYFMLGLPTETDEDALDIANLCEEISEQYYLIPKDQRNGKVSITASSSFFVPKPFTPFQWASMATKEQFLNRAKIVNNHMKELLNRKSIKYNWHEADVTVIEGLLARGDRRVSDIIYRAYTNGALYDAWSDSYHNEYWLKAIDESGLSLDFYTTRQRDVNEILPWDFIDIGVTKKFLIKEWENAQSERVTPNCAVKCSGCGAFVYNGGLCHED